jgi:hypothetical protein
MATTVLQAIQEANTAAGITTLAYANSQEFKAFMDKFAFTDYPVNLVLPFTVNGTTLNGRRKAVITLTGYVWKRVPEDGNDWRTLAVETSYIEPMRTLAIKFIKSLLDTDIIDPEVEAVTDTITPEYAETSGHLFGVKYTVQIPTLQNVCIDAVSYIISENSVNTVA